MSVQQEDSQMEAKSSFMDRINNVPLGIVEDILCLLPTKEAVRTSILSKKWRYGWVRVPKLVFNEEDIFGITRVRRSTTEAKELARKFKSKLLAIYQVMLLHQGPILEFGLSLNLDFLLHKEDPTYPSSTGSDMCVEIDRIITHLVRNNNTVKKFTLDLDYYSTYRPHLSIFSLCQLTDLYIEICKFDYDPTFSGFGSLTSLHLGTHHASKNSLLHLFSNCPLLKSVTLDFRGSMDEAFTIGELFKCLSVIEYLSVKGYYIRCSAQDRVARVLPAPLLNLKHICLDMLALVFEYGLLLIGFVIRSSPNLETFKISILFESYDHDDEIVTMEDCSDIRLEHLKEFEFTNFTDGVGEMDFVKLMLGKSPVLKKARIILGTKVTTDEGSRMRKMLLESPRASQRADIIAEHPSS